MNNIRLLGIQFELHPLFVLIMIASIFTGNFVELVTLFGVVFIHELGHITAAKWFNWRIRKIVLLPFGGVAEMDENGTVPAYEELIVAIAGPLQNILMIVFAWLMSLLGVWTIEWTHYFIIINLTICLFNLLPILPLDGGKIMFAIICYYIPYYRCLQLCFMISLTCSFCMLVYPIVQYSFGAELSLNVLLLAIFLLYSNIMMYRQLPYYFIRFLIYRKYRVNYWVEQHRLAVPILGTFHTQLEWIVKQYMREQLHFILIKKNERISKPLGALPEQQLTDFYLNAKPSSKIVDILK